MNQSKFSLADVLTVLTALAFGFVCFLGLNFYTLGNTSQSIILSVIITVLLGAPALGAKIIKRSSRNFKANLIMELIVLVLFTGVMIIFAYSPFPHYFTVYEQKELIQNKLATSITQAEKMFSDYESYAQNREDLYKSKLLSVASAKNINPSEYDRYGFVRTNVSDNIQIENKMFIVHAELFPTNYSDTTNLNGIKEVATEWFESAKGTTRSWKPIGIVSVVNDVERNSKDWQNQLTLLSQSRQSGEDASDFEYSLSFEVVKNHLTNLGGPTTLSIFLAIVAYALMLLSWIVSSRHTKSPGVKELLKQIFIPSSSDQDKGEYDIEY